MLLWLFRFDHHSFALYEELGSCLQTSFNQRIPNTTIYFAIRAILFTHSLAWNVCVCRWVCPVTLNFVFRLIFCRACVASLSEKVDESLSIAEKSSKQPLACERTRNSAYGMPAIKWSTQSNNNQKKTKKRKENRRTRRSSFAQKRKTFESKPNQVYFVRLAWCFVSVLLSTFGLHN